MSLFELPNSENQHYQKSISCHLEFHHNLEISWSKYFYLIRTVILKKNLNNMYFLHSKLQQCIIQETAKNDIKYHFEFHYNTEISQSQYLKGRRLF